MPSLLVCVPHLMLTQRENILRKGRECRAGQASWEQSWQRGLTSWCPRSHCLLLHAWAGLSLSCPRWNARRGSSVVLQSYRELDTWELSVGRGKGKEHRWRAWEARAIGSCSISVIFYVHFCGVVLTIGKSLHCTSSGVFLRCSTVFSQSIN